MLPLLHVFVVVVVVIDVFVCLPLPLLLLRVSLVVAVVGDKINLIQSCVSVFVSMENINNI